MQEQIKLLQEGLEDIRRQITQLPAATTTAQPPPPTRHACQDSTEGNPHSSAPRQPRGRPPPSCFLCGEEGHPTARCVALQHLLRQPTPARLLERPSETKVAQVGCRVGPPITGQLTLEGIPVLGLVDTGASVTCLGFDIWWGSARCTRQTTTDCWKNPASGPPVGRGSRAGLLHCHRGLEVAPMSHRHGHYAATPCPYRCDQWDCDPGPT